mmetsp:Transcript_54617/g.144854  ORF Transcript_54617/g.144854 Transcript_54617/m.144854 type:complete len:216 (+) Transcript_54617:1832-2479(+)
MASTARRMRTSTPLSAAFSARAIVYSYGMSVPASGEKRAAVADGSRCGSISKSSSLRTMRRLSTPLVAPRAISSSRCSSSSAPRATTREPVSWYPKWRSSSRAGNIWLPFQQRRARVEPGLSSYPACTIPLLPLVAPWHTSSAASTITTLAVVFASSRATAAPMQPLPITMQSYVPSSFAAEWRVAERGHAVSSVRLFEPPSMLNFSPHSSSGTQ